MDEQLSEWLKLREDVDAVSRAGALMRRVAEAMAGLEEVRILDLATGAGSNVRYLAERLPGRQRWLVVDRSPQLLSHLVLRTEAWARQRGYDAETSMGVLTIRGQGRQWDITPRERDLNVVDQELVDGRQLVTASALLDLVSESWLRSIASHCRAAGAVALFPIVYNGKSSSWPAEPEDEMVLDLFNRHQRTDKGLGGPAAGPSATDAAVRAFAAEGFHVDVEPSDWVLADQHQELQRQLIDGWAFAASEMGPESAEVVARWKARRMAHVDAGRSRILVGHFDLAAFPPSRQAQGPAPTGA
jgi:hypothetical protein